MTHLEKISPKLELFDQLERIAVEHAEQRDASVKVTRSQAKKALSQIEDEIQELVRMRAQRLISDEDFKIYRAALLRRRKATEQAPAQNAISADEIRDRLRELSQPLHTLVATWHGMLPKIRARFQQLIFPGGFVVGSIRTADLGLLFRVFGGLARGESDEVHSTYNSWNRIHVDIQELLNVLREYQSIENTSRKCVRKKSTD